MFARQYRKIMSGFIVCCLICLSFFSIFILNGIIDFGDASATTIIVDGNGNGNYSTIQEAIDKATYGDTIRVWAGVYIENIVIDKGLKIIGNGSANTTIDGRNSWWASTIEISASEVYVSGFSITQNSWTGIYIGFSSNICLTNNSISNNDFNGINIFMSNDVVIENNNFTQNNYTGIALSDSKNCRISNNTISQSDEGVSIDFSTSITLSNNTFTGCGVVIESSSWSDYVSHWTSHEIDGLNSVNGKPLIYWKNKNSGTVPTGAGEIIIANCTNIIINNQNCNDGSVGILIGISDRVTVNNCITNFNTYGINIQISSNITVTNNNISSNSNEGLYLFQSSSNIISNNVCDHNGYSGISLDGSSYNDISNNTANQNQDVGLYTSLSNFNSLAYNEFNENWFSGLFLGWESQFNDIRYNEMCKNNVTGVYTGSSSNNTFIGNNVSKNMNGIELGWDSLCNNIFENDITFNSKYGIFFNNNCDFNTFYHNNIIKNKNQVSTSNGINNRWSKNSEGNYWSDYRGLDDGSDDRTSGDLIGDTDLPHPGAGFDEYPFILPNGWQYPGLPMIRNPGSLDSDGNYNITWKYRDRAVGYILEEDDNPAFESPTMIYDGPGAAYEFSDKPEGTYYYRLMIYSAWYYSQWSKNVNITVDYSPSAPVNFSVGVNPQGGVLNISWDPYLIDITCYELFYKTGTMTEFIMLANLTHPNHTYTHSGLIDGQPYYYKVRSKDNYWQESMFSEIISAAPEDSMAPEAPTGLSAEAVSDTEIKLTWSPTPDDDLNGYIVYMHDPVNDLPGVFNLKYTLPETKTSHTVTGLTEQVTYQFRLKSFDEVPNNSTFSVVVNATTLDLTHPGTPKGLKITDHTYNSLTITWYANTDNDLMGYRVFRSKSKTDGFENITGIVNSTVYVDTCLDETTSYYYKIKAVDDAGLESSFSEIAIGMTLLGPRSPLIENAINDFELEEDSIDDSTISLFDVFKDPNGDKMVFRCEGQNNINVTIDQDSGLVVLKPDQNWNGAENLKFYANDSIYEVFELVEITVTPVNDAPTQVMIIKPINGYTIQVNDMLDFESECSDADLPYGEVLTFNWYSSISGSLGTGKNLSNVLLDPGEHVITLEVSDLAGESASAKINVTVQKASAADETNRDAKENYTFISAGIIITIIIVLLAILLVYLRKKRTPKTDLEDEDSEKEE